MWVLKILQLGYGSVRPFLDEPDTPTAVVIISHCSCALGVGGPSKVEFFHIKRVAKNLAGVLRERTD